MSGSVLTYDPRNVTILISGWQLVGVQSVRLEWKSKPFTVYKGIRGVNTRVFNQDMGATVVIETLPTSITNDVLSNIVIQDRATSSARIEFTVKDTSGTTLFQSTNAFVNGLPNTEFNAEQITNRMWEIEILSFVEFFSGGNAQDGIDINDLLSGPLEGVTSFAEGMISNVSDRVTSFF